MADFKEYIASNGQCGDVDVAVLDDLLARYEWFSVARTVRAHLLGASDPRSAVMAASRGVSSLELQPIDISRLLDADMAGGAAARYSDIDTVCDAEPKGEPCCSAEEPDASTSSSVSAEGGAANSCAVSSEHPQDDVIERFLHLDNYRIIADENAPDEEILTEAQLSDEDDVVSEELAEVYLSQGLRDEACAIYRKLSLLNPKKSVYFAEIIEKIENNN